MQNSKVALQVCKDYVVDKVKRILEQEFDYLGGITKFIKPNSKVLIKPDLYMLTEPNKAKTTHPNIISALTELVEKAGAECIIADCPKGNFNQANLDKMYSKTQMLEASNDGYAVLNFNDAISIIHNKNGESERKFYVMDAINDVDVIINVGKFRCDKNLGLIGCSQNIFGILPDDMKKLVKNRCFTLNKYYNYIIDLFESIEHKIILNILDGVVSCESNDDPRILNTILMGENPYEVDSVALKIINQDPHDNLLLENASRRGKLNPSISTQIDIPPLILTDYNYPNLKYGATIKNGSASKFRHEYNRTQKRAIICPKNCKGCKTCINICPMGAISMKVGELGEEYAVIDYDKCINCLQCVKNCPYQIITTKTPLKYKLLTKNIDKKIKK